MRLVDADKLDGYILTKHGESNKVLCSKSIADVPTAYDVDDVVKEIQKILKNTMHIRANKDVNKDFYKGLECAYEVAIDVIKNGGVK